MTPGEKLSVPTFEELLKLPKEEREERIILLGSSAAGAMVYLISRGVRATVLKETGGDGGEGYDPVETFMGSPISKMITKTINRNWWAKIPEPDDSSDNDSTRMIITLTDTEWLIFDTCMAIFTIVLTYWGFNHPDVVKSIGTQAIAEAGDVGTAGIKSLGQLFDFIPSL